MTVYERGSFGFAPVLGLTSHHWPPHNHENLYMGLPPAGQHMWGSFRVGNRRVVPIRQTQNELAVRFLLFDGEAHGDLALSAVPRAFTGIADVTTRDNRWGLFQPGSKPRFAFASNADSALWREENLFEVVGTPIGTAIQLAVPDATEPFGYRARFWKVAGGTSDGMAVEGVFGHEQVYLRPGGGWFTSLYMRELEQAWIVFVTVFDDGSTVHGHICVGRENWKFAAVQRSGGTSITTTAVKCHPTFDADGFADAVDFILGDGSRWTFRPSSSVSGRMPLPGAGPKWREGIVTEADDSRTIAFSHAWSEVFPERFP